MRTPTEDFHGGFQSLLVGEEEGGDCWCLCECGWRQRSVGESLCAVPWCSLCASLGQMLSFAAGQTCSQRQELCPTDWDGESLCAHSRAAPFISVKTQGMFERVVMVGQWAHLQSGLGKTILHVIRKLIQLTIIESKWEYWKTTYIHIYRD